MNSLVQLCILRSLLVGLSRPFKSNMSVNDNTWAHIFCRLNLSRISLRYSQRVFISDPSVLFL